MLINCLKIAQKINKNTYNELEKLKKTGLFPKIVVVLVGDDKNSLVYIKQKEKLAKKLGFDFELIKLNKKINTLDLKTIINSLQKQKDLCGIIIQLPLPKKIDKDEVLNSLSLNVDIDCLSAYALGRLYQDKYELEPPTVGAIMEILRSLKIKLPGKEIVIVGAGILVGKPLTAILMKKRATITVCNSATKNLKKKCLNADIIISGAGVKNLLRADMVKKGTIVIDAGFSFINGKSYGDSDYLALHKKGVLVTPTPGGVGPITVSKLMSNAVKCAELKFKLKS